MSNKNHYLQAKFSVAVFRICRSDENPGEPERGSPIRDSAEPACISRSTPVGEANSSSRGREDRGAPTTAADPAEKKNHYKNLPMQYTEIFEGSKI